MFQKFFTDTYISKFIKALLANTEIPMYDAVCDGDFILKDEFYIYNSSLIRCKTSGTLPDTYLEIRGLNTQDPFTPSMVIMILKHTQN